MNKGRVICLLLCSLMLALCIWMCGCVQKSDSANDTSAEDMICHITIYRPNSTEVFVEGDGTVYWLKSSNSKVKVSIGDKIYWTHWNNVVVEWDVK